MTEVNPRTGERTPVDLEGLPPGENLNEMLDALDAGEIKMPTVQVSNRHFYAGKSDEEIEQMGLVPDEPYDPEALIETPPVSRTPEFDWERGTIRLWAPGDQRIDFDVRQIRDWSSLEALKPHCPTCYDKQRFIGELRSAIHDACEWGFNDHRALDNLKPGETLPPWPCNVTPLYKLERAQPGDGNELLRFRWLCRGAGALIVGPTGVGKSSLSMQCALMWAIEREAFGIIPSRPLKSLFIQAENDEGDLAEMRDGVVKGIGLNADEQGIALANVLIASEDSKSGPDFFYQILEPAVRAHRPDLVWIDPALAYLGGESNNQKDVGAFLRNYLNPIIHKYDCAVIVVHHTAKPNQNTAEWTASQLSYLGGGSSEWANWARAILVLDSGGTPPGVFRLHAPKRGVRLRWKQADGETPAYTKVIAHAKEPGVICWKELTGDEAVTVAIKTKRQHTVEDVMAHVPLTGDIGKQTLANRCQSSGIGLNKAKALIAEAIETGRLYEWRTKRSGKRDEITVSRSPQELRTLDTNGENQALITTGATGGS